MRLSSKGIAHLHKWEGCRLKAYQDVAGIWTIGFGHTSAAGSPVVKPGMIITQAQANEIFKVDLRQFEIAVSEWVKVPLTQNQFDALVSLCYNIGPGAFKRSTLLKQLNRRDYNGAANEFPKWNKSGGRVVQGLINRRAAERAMFLASASRPSTQATKPTYTLWDFIKRIFGR